MVLKKLYRAGADLFPLRIGFLPGYLPEGNRRFATLEVEEWLSGLKRRS